MRALPIRIRLTLWYFAMFATAACLLSAVSWWMLRRSIDATEYHDLQERAEDVQLLLLNQAPNRSINDLRLEFTAIYAIKDDGKWLQILDQDGNWIYRSKRMLAENPDLPRPERLPDTGTIAEFHQGTRHVRILAYPIRVREKKYSVQTGIALNKSAVLLKTFGTDLLLLTPGMILLAALGGHWMSRKALQPVALLAEEARRINDRNLDIRLPVPTAQDEISDLSRTLNQMLERIDNAFASVRAFTGNASHELRTPITLLRTEIEIALFRPREGGEYRATLTRLHEETIRMGKLVETLLSIARADAGAEKMVMQAVDVSGLFQRMNQDWMRIMQLARLDFRTEVEDHDLVVLGDPASLSRLLSILLDNGRQYTPPGGYVVLTGKNDGTRIRFSVRDNGIGIAEEDLPRIFERFYRGGSMQESRGSGLGLALGKWIAERHGTQLLVESEAGQGSDFSFSLMRVDPALGKERLLVVSSSEARRIDSVAIE
jgi:signal transduction histidine kinase